MSKRKKPRRQKASAPFKSFEIKLEMLPAGIAATSARAGDTTASIICREFTSTEDGQLFIQRIEGFPQKLLDLILAQHGIRIKPSAIDHILAIFRPDQTATVYVNSLPHRALARVSRPFKAGEAVFKSDFVDVERLEFVNVTVPPEAGVLFLFSSGWRKGLFFDLLPLRVEDRTSRDYDLCALLGQLYSRVMFQERYSILDLEWQKLFDAKLFPFAGLAHSTLDRILAHLRAGWPLDELSEIVVAEVKNSLPSYLEKWREHSAFATHIEIIDRASERFLAADYISSIGILLPRIEGILRSYHVAIGRQDKPTQWALTESAVSAKADATLSALLPLRFQAYLKEVYFAAFDGNMTPGSVEIDVSRHSVAHGVAGADSFNPLNAAIGFLILHQLFYCFRPDKEQSCQAVAP